MQSRNQDKQKDASMLPRGLCLWNNLYLDAVNDGVSLVDVDADDQERSVGVGRS